ncbi:DUF5071 domain-containing protein [Ureibacillus sp. 179-F W5.1 NHS]|uniref:DUF5071 domain-containing protein n=1 Tax=Bacillales TaxID=1385 RepID=UPI001313E204|nr:DUF5071 domain-containing protein [Lysinibacillus halotolerans]
MEASVEQLLTLSEEEKRSNLPFVLEWLKVGEIERNEGLAELLLQYPAEITPFIFELLEGEAMDYDLKKWMMENVICKLPFFVKIALEEQLQRIAQLPTDEERKRKLHEVAQTVLDSFI